MNPLSRTLVLLAVITIAAASSHAQPTTRKLIRATDQAPNLLVDSNWRPMAQGRPFTRDGPVLILDNAAESNLPSGINQSITLNQKTPLPIVASVLSKAENVGGSRNSDYSIYLDLVYMDGGHLWGQVAMFDVGSHDYQRREVRILPEKPVKSLSVNLLLRRHAGKVWFKDAALQQIEVPRGAGLLDGQLVATAVGADGVFVRDVAAQGDFETGTVVLPPAGATTSQPIGVAEGIAVSQEHTVGIGTSNARPRFDHIYKYTLRNTTGRDRAITFVVTEKVESDGLRCLMDPYTTLEPKSPREYRLLDHTGRFSRYPFSAVVADNKLRMIYIDPEHPAVFRVGYAAATSELYIAWDVALTKEQPTVTLKYHAVAWFDADWGFRSAVQAWLEHSPALNKARIKSQGLWMPFHPISKVKGWEDFGFAIKEGDSETAWDDAHNILTFRYTEPMTWWMKMAKDSPRTIEAATAQAQALANKGDKSAKAFLSSGHHDSRGQFIGQIRSEPWCDGIVWSMNSMPGLSGDPTDFKNKWNESLKEKLYGAKKKADLDGEYVDSIEGWVTDDYDLNRAHFAGAQTPLTFTPDTFQPAIHKGLISFEYTRALKNDVHAMGKYMMANGAGHRFCFLVPLLDVNGTETNWNPRGKWQPMAATEMIRQRILCGQKPYCFLMNTEFERFGPDLVEKYMKRSLAFGMFPGFFSHNASQGHYFSRPELYDRDRPLFKKYVPLCKKVAQAGWQPITLARSSQPQVLVERWGANLLTVFNGSSTAKQTTLKLDGLDAAAATDLLTGKVIEFKDKSVVVDLPAEDVMVLELESAKP